MNTQHAADAHGVEPSVVNQTPDRLRMDAELVGDLTNADELRLLLRGWRCAAMLGPVELVSSGALCGRPCSRASASGTDTHAHRPSATQVASSRRGPRAPRSAPSRRAVA